MHGRDIKMPRAERNRSKEGCAQERGKPSCARRGKELDRKKRHKIEGAQEGKRVKLHVRERDSLCMCKKSAQNYGKEYTRDQNYAKSVRNYKADT